jgi:transketolase
MGGAVTAAGIRELSLEAVHKAGKGHIGGVLSCADILAALFGGVLRDFGGVYGDRFILSKGHCAVGLYAALALRGDIPMDELGRLNQGGMLGEHPDRRIHGVEVTSGSLGHGLGLACGLALADRMNREHRRTFVLMGDGECWEGSVWEAAMFGAHHRLNITVIVDRNGYAVQGATEEIVALGNLAAKWKAFGWETQTCDGHEEEVLKVILDRDGPRVVIADTVKGKGVSWMEGRKEWHHGSLNVHQLNSAREEIHGHA